MRFLLADDHQIVRLGIRGVLKRNFPSAIIDETESAAGVMSNIRSHIYDLAFFDVQMPDSSDFMLVTNVLNLQPQLKIIVLSVLNEEVYGKRFIKSGAMAYLSKETEEDVILKAVNTVLAGKKFIVDKIADALKEKTADAEASPFDRLSNREMEIVRRLLDGESNSQISASMNIGASTVATHKIHILEKLGIKTLVDLIKLARMHGLLT